MRLQWQAIIAVIGIASMLGSCEKRLTPNASAGEARPVAAAAPAPAAASAAAITPRTQPPQVAKNLSKAFAATAKAVGVSVVRIDVHASRPPSAQRGGGGADGNPFS
jgi:hypothetical protein